MASVELSAQSVCVNFLRMFWPNRRSEVEWRAWKSGLGWVGFLGWWFGLLEPGGLGWVGLVLGWFWVGLLGWLFVGLGWVGLAGVGLGWALVLDGT